MKKSCLATVAFITFLAFHSVTPAQSDDMCREFGVMPSLDSPFAQIPYVFGRVRVIGLDTSGKLPRISVLFIDRNQSEHRLSLGRSGNYCFKRSGAGGTLVIEIDGVESARRSLPGFGATQQREDFEIEASRQSQILGSVSAKFSHPKNDKTIGLYAKVIDAEKTKDLAAATGYLEQIVAIDPSDFIAWAKLGSIHFERDAVAKADTAFRRSLELKPEYTPVWVSVGKLRIVQKQPEAAIEIFKHAISLEPESARIHRLLGETYLQTKQGTLAVDALNQAIKLDPIGMAECHLLIARLYDLAGAKQHAAREYKAFLAKVPEHPEKKKLEKYIKDNPD